MQKTESGMFKKRTKGFTVTLNSVLHESNISTSAIGLYVIINSYISIPGFDVSKNFIFSKCREGKKAFDSMWKELKNAGYLIQEFRPDVNNKGRFTVTYELLDEPAEDGIHTRYFNVNGEVTKELYTTSYLEQQEVVTESEENVAEENKDDVTDLYEKIVTENNKTDKNDHVPEKGGMVENENKIDHIPKKGGMVETEKKADRYPFKGVTLKGGDINNTINNNTNSLLNIDSNTSKCIITESDSNICIYPSSELERIHYSVTSVSEEKGTDKKNDEEKESLKENQSKDDIQSVSDSDTDAAKNTALETTKQIVDFIERMKRKRIISKELLKYICNNIFESTDDSKFSVGKNLVSKEKMIKRILALTDNQIAYVDDVFRSGKIYTPNGLSTYIFNAAFMNGQVRREYRNKYEQRDYQTKEIKELECKLLGLIHKGGE